MRVALDELASASIHRSAWKENSRKLPSIIMRTPGNLAVMSGTHGGT
jgi:hypothetical protein